MKNLDYQKSQNQIEPEDDKELSFGPFDTTLSELFDRGFYLYVCFPNHFLKLSSERRSKLYLIGGGKKYLIRKINWRQYTQNSVLSHYVENGKDFLSNQSADKYEDPWECILRRYSSPKKTKSILVGNRTVREKLEETLGVLP